MVSKAEFIRIKILDTLFEQLCGKQDKLMTYFQKIANCYLKFKDKGLDKLNYHKYRAH